MSNESTDAVTQAFPLGDDRYRIERLLGSGGMAFVYEAHDMLQQRRVALKRLQPVTDAVRHQRNVELFEREFHVLSHLAHPRIVQVYDFGVDASGAYYTMELLQGGDLQQLAPLPWRRVCAAARDVCSALSLLHSRRLVHRDVSPRNVRCLPEGTAKLIDFGALAPMGTTKLVVGTPPCCAPESVQRQMLDGRTDLFGLGATLYYVLVGRHAYPARQFSTLSDAWRCGFARPSELVVDIPQALDALVLDLLRLEPDARPASAAEVMDRLCAIDGEGAAEELLSAQAYLSAPPLVGRQTALERVQRRVKRAPGGRSRSVVIEGAAGAGRTRFLDACLLDATLAGHIVVRADADDALSGDYGVARAIARQLLERSPQATRDAARPVLEQIVAVIPELANDVAPEAQPQRFARPRVQEGLHTWLTTLSRTCSFVLAIDDFHRIDEPSAAVLALLEHASTRHELCLLITAETGAAWTAESAGKLLQATTTIHLEDLSYDETEKLLGSLFGTTPNLGLTAHRLHALCQGNPRATLSLAQHLVDRGVIKYASGAWTLPGAIDEHDLPANLSQALSARIDALGPIAKRLACAIALAQDQSFTFAECGLLADVADPALLLAELEDLMTAEIVRRVGDDIALARVGWASLLQTSLTRDAEVSLHRLLAMMFERRAGQEFRASQHWFRAGELARGLDSLVSHAELTQEKTAHGPEIFLSYLLSMPPDWLETFEQGLRACDALNRPHRQAFGLLMRLVGITSLLNTHAAGHTTRLFRQLSQDSGLDDWAALPESLEPKPRLLRALALAHERYKAASEHDRVLDPVTAIRHLARAVVSAVGGVVLALDIENLRAMPDLAPLATISPALDVTCKLVAGVDARCTGRIARARRIYSELLALVQQPDGGGLEASHAEYVLLGVMNGMGMIEAGLGLESCLGWAAQIERNPNYEVNACVIRRLYRLYQGDIGQAEVYKQAADRLRIQNSGRQMFEGGHLIWEVHAHALSADITRMRQVSEEIAPLAKRYPHWEPVLRYATAEHHRIVRDPHKACAEIEKLLPKAAAGVHQIWTYATIAHVYALLESERATDALERAQGYIEIAKRELDYVSEHLQLALATALAHNGVREATAVADGALKSLESSGVTGLRLGTAYETRARIALRLEDTSGFARYAERCRAIYLVHKNSALIARYHRLVQEGRQRFIGTQEHMTATPDSVAQYSGSRVELALASCRDDEQRARLALTILTRQAGATAGLYFSHGPEGVVCLAQLGGVSPTPKLQGCVEAYLARCGDDSDDTKTETEDELENEGPVELVDDAGRVYKPIIIRHVDGGQMVVTGLVVLVASEARRFIYPSEAAAAVSRYAAKHGATSLMLLVDD